MMHSDFNLNDWKLQASKYKLQKESAKSTEAVRATSTSPAAEFDYEKLNKLFIDKGINALLQELKNLKKAGVIEKINVQSTDGKTTVSVEADGISYKFEEHNAEKEDNDLEDNNLGGTNIYNPKNNNHFLSLEMGDLIDKNVTLQPSGIQGVPVIVVKPTVNEEELQELEQKFNNSEFFRTYMIDSGFEADIKKVYGNHTASKEIILEVYHAHEKDFHNYTKRELVALYAQEYKKVTGNELEATTPDTNVNTDMTEPNYDFNKLSDLTNYLNSNEFKQVINSLLGEKEVSQDIIDKLVNKHVDNFKEVTKDQIIAEYVDEYNKTQGTTPNNPNPEVNEEKYEKIYDHLRKKYKKEFFEKRPEADESYLDGYDGFGLFKEACKIVAKSHSNDTEEMNYDKLFNEVLKEYDKLVDKTVNNYVEFKTEQDMHFYLMSNSFKQAVENKLPGKDFAGEILETLLTKYKDDFNTVAKEQLVEEYINEYNSNYDGKGKDFDLFMHLYNYMDNGFQKDIEAAGETFIYSLAEKVIFKHSKDYQQVTKEQLIQEYKELVAAEEKYQARKAEIEDTSEKLSNKIEYIFNSVINDIIQSVKVDNYLKDIKDNPNVIPAFNIDADGNIDFPNQTMRNVYSRLSTQLEEKYEDNPEIKALIDKLGGKDVLKQILQVAWIDTYNQYDSGKNVNIEDFIKQVIKNLKSLLQSISQNGDLLDLLI